ncbi:MULTISPECIES: hypothetical protein [Halorussus]|uniref:Uncharacterized protein n=2 Tax=Halorussus TaxID=1070314 RepID=A0A8U0HUH0_9EURY|nr:MULTISPECIES: hypothetical protein [Halorussus]UPV74578.1 hypothetical protein M0R89_00570 [Halorussus limi]
MSDNAGYSAAQLRELLKREDGVDALEEAGLLTEREVNLLDSFVQHHKPSEEAYYPEDHPLFQRLLRRAVSQNVRQAVESGNVSQMQFASGVVNNSNDISGVQLYERLREFITRTAGVTTVYGHMGSGKTDLALLLAELWKSATGGVVGTNIRSAKEADFEITDVEKLHDWINGDMEGVEKDTPKLFIGDEFSSHASGYSHHRAKVEQNLSSTLKLMRKSGVSVVIIGHTGMDVHPDVRRLSKTVWKENKKSATVYETIENGEPEDELFSLSGIPAADWTYDTLEETDWDWCIEEEDDEQDIKQQRDRWMATAYESQDLTQAEVADVFDVSEKTVRRAVKSHS